MVGGLPDSAPDAMKTRSRLGGGYNTAGINSNCPEPEFSCGRYKAIDFTLLIVVAVVAVEDDTCRGSCVINAAARSSNCECAKS